MLCNSGVAPSAAPPEEFQKLVAAGTLRHVGLTESIAMIAAGLGWELDKTTESIEPVIARERVKSQYITVEPGQANDGLDYIRVVGGHPLT